MSRRLVFILVTVALSRNRAVARWKIRCHSVETGIVGWVMVMVVMMVVVLMVGRVGLEML